ncbi:cryptochrome/photolyase family protein [Muriicola sp. Z0-33]|uniref:cryptochrome/photolyase family protein n=1 Tax=Muriicola sp. Z0-33 TaxID=2816957 RepID=UPI002238ECF0|nr:deoxyribodipyrimidine photo-lyase [Muriicola sp. Z0-33]MCW5515525.1 deoxyribodipyrimidine photo-lyase [Muriicola sp. Z0-33]
MKTTISIFWFRRDLRLEDNAGLHAALMDEHPVLPIFIFDPDILDQLANNDARITFIHSTLKQMNKSLDVSYQCAVSMYFGKPVDIFEQLIGQFDIRAVFTNHDYEPYAIKRDKEVGEILDAHQIELKTFKDQVLFEKDEVLKNDGTPYVVYTPYMRKWKEQFNAETHLKEFSTAPFMHRLMKLDKYPTLSLSDIGFLPSSIRVVDYDSSPEIINNYEATRNFPALIGGTSRLGPHLRFGTVSIRKMVRKAIAEENEIFWNELIWREFFMQILWHYPHTVLQAFKPKYDRIKWRNDEDEFKKWTSGTTGYALVDAGMRELNKTGYMHNRVRMLVASFLCKHLLIDWRWGEAYFAQKLLDYEMSSNVGNWQWAAGSGVDAAPYFRIFNPMTQIKKFDKDHKYINKWVPELQQLSYPDKMVEHKMARERCLAAYKEALQ